MAKVYCASELTPIRLKIFKTPNWVIGKSFSLIVVQ